MKNTLTFYEQIILDNIDLEAYEIKVENNFDKVNKAYKIFLSEYGHVLNRMSEERAFEEYLRGLPSILTVPFYNYEILNMAYAHNLLPANASEDFEDNFLNRYWGRLAVAFFTLKNNL